MDYTKEFMAQYVCEVPGFLPEELRERLDLLSCLSEKETRAVYLCQNRESGEKMILKVAEPSSPDSIAREYFLLKKLDHPAIPKAFLYSQDDQGREYLLRSYAEGETLDRLLERDGVFDIRRTLEIIQKVCAILSYLHRQNPPIIYRDLKPQNILITPNGKVTLIDFGISREEDRSKEFDTIFVGSAGFAAPEQFGFSKTDLRSDIFALGKLMLYLSTGQTNLPEFKKTVPSRALVKLITKCTQLSPEKRFDSVDKLSRAIDKVLYPPTRRELLWGGAAALAVVAVGIFVLLRVVTPAPESAASGPVPAEGSQFKQQVQIPVDIKVLMDGKPYTDCAVAVDNHHWFAPARTGDAQLLVYAFDNYKARAADRNRTAVMEVSVSREGQPHYISFDLAQVPTAPESVDAAFPYGQDGALRLDIDGAQEVALSGQPEGVEIEQREDGWYLTVSAKVPEPGHYTIFMDATNDFGKADTIVGLHLAQEKPVVEIDTVAALNAVRDDLSGCYRLKADLDLSGADWMSIGTPEYPFTGQFDGGGHTITGLHMTTQKGHSGLFGTVDKAIIRNVIIQDANISVHVSGGTGFGILAGDVKNGLVENCAVLGGSLRADIGLESSAGGVVGVNAGILRRCFNAASVTIHTTGSKDWTDSFAGGVCGTSNGYMEICANVAPVTGISMAGGVAGFTDQGIMARCYNAGTVDAPAFAGLYPAGGVSHMLGRGRCIRYCAFEEGTAQVGSTVFNGGTLLGIEPLRKEEFENLQRMQQVFHDEETQQQWEYVPQYPGYPVPRGIFPLVEALDG